MKNVLQTYPDRRLYYLATPYSHEDKSVCELRFKLVNSVAAILMARGMFVFSPISHSHPIAMAGTLPTDWAFWEKVDELFISKCDEMLILEISGWDTSRGVTAEIEIAKKHSLAVRWVDPVGILGGYIHTPSVEDNFVKMATIKHEDPLL